MMPRILLSAFLALALTACSPDSGSAVPPAAAAAPEKKAPSAPGIPGGESAAEFASDVYQGVDGAGPRKAKRGYVQDETLPAGSIRGVCVIHASADVKPPAAESDVAATIVKPEAGEAEYFRNMKLSNAGKWWFHAQGKRNPKGDLGVSGAVVCVRNALGGRRPALEKSAFVTRDGNLRPGGVQGYSAGSRAVFAGAQNERLAFTAFDKFTCHLHVRKVGGQEVFEGTCSRVETSDVGNGRSGYLKKPTMLESPALGECGPYEVCCGRHPWQRVFLYVHDSPCIAVSGVSQRESECGAFAIDGLPAGRHTLEVWHPEFEPVARTVEVEVKADTTTQLLIEFKMPLN